MHITCLRTTVLLIACIICSAFLSLSCQQEGSETSKPGGKEIGISPDNVIPLIRVSPRGRDVAQLRQVTFDFENPLVPLGKMERDSRAIPLYFEPSLNCQWRWLSTSSLACELDKKDALKKASSYRLRINLGQASEESEESKLIRAGAQLFLAKEGEVEIQTILPKLESSELQTWSAPGEPILGLRFNQQVLARSVVEHVFFQLQDSKLRIPPRILPQAVDDKGHFVEYPEEGARTKIFEQNYYYKVVPEKNLGVGQEFSLIVESGLVSPEGSLPGKVGVEVEGEGKKSVGLEERVMYRSRTFPEFSFLGLRCCVDDPSFSGEEYRAEYYCRRGSYRLLSATQASTGELRCDSQDAIEIVLSSPVLKDSFRENLNFSPDPRGNNKELDIWADVNSYSQLWRERTRNRVYALRLPYGLKAYQKYHLQAEGEKIRDEFGRSLNEDISFTFYTAHRLPRFVIGDAVSVLEAGEDTHLPVAIQNLDALTFNYQSYVLAGKQLGKTVEIPVDNVQDLSYYFPLKIRDLIPAPSGVLWGKLSSLPDPAEGNKPYSPFIVSQVTPFHIHGKLGHFNTLVWVTSLKDGSPVAGARVKLYTENMGEFSSAPRDSAEAFTDEDGVAMLPGTSSLDPEAKIDSYWDSRRVSPVFKVQVEHEGKLGFLPLVSQLQLTPYGNNAEYISSERKAVHGHLKAWGTTPQGIYKLGQNLQYKIYVREENGRELTPAPRSGYDLRVYDPMGRLVHEVLNLELSEFGGYSGEFLLIETGAVGTYNFQLVVKYAPAGTGWRDATVKIKDSEGKEKEVRALEPLKVLVSDFTPSTFKVKSDITSDLIQPSEKLRILTEASLHAGGAYANGTLRLSARLIPRALSVRDPQAANFSFDTGQWPNSRQVFQEELKLDANGSSSFEYQLGEQSILYGSLVVESAVRDDRGRYIAAEDSAVFAARDRYVGLRFPRWMYPAGDEVELQALVVDESGSLVRDQPLSVTIKREVVQASRVKGAGNVYETHYETSREEVTSCDLIAGDAAVSCTFVPEQAGRYLAEATIKDTLGRLHRSSASTWVSGPGEVVWSSDTNNRLDIVPEKDSYKLGETAKFLLKNPFPGAKALISVERYGVISHWVQPCPEALQTIELPITPEMLPGFYLSVVIMSGRVAPASPDLRIDLGKPSMRMGYAKVRVKDTYDELDIKVRSEQEVYKPGEKVRVGLLAKTKQGETPENLEYAVAVLDESVFDLISSGREYFDPYRGFFSLSDLDLTNFNLLLELVGRRKFEKKGVNSGGDGSASMSKRGLFKYVAYWNPSLLASNKGEAEFDFIAPDNLTGWRVLALALTPGQQMGLGEGNFKVNKLTEIRPALPNQVHVGDSFSAEFVLMNRANESRKLEVHLEAKGEGVVAEPLTFSLEAESFERLRVSLPLKVEKAGEISFIVSAKDEFEGDLLEVPLKVLPASAPRTSALYDSFDRSEASQTIKIPREISEEGEITLSLSPSVLEALEGAFIYLRDYSYSCWEQRLSRTMMASNYEKLKSYLPGTFSWQSSDKLPQEDLDRAQSFQAGNGGMAYYLASDAYADPYLSAYTALAFSSLREDGYRVPTQVSAKLESYLFTFLRKNTAPDFYTDSLSSTVRAVALHALSREGKLRILDLQRLKAAMPGMSSFGLAHYSLAALNTEGADEIARESHLKLLARTSRTGGKVVFIDEIDQSVFSRILSSPLRSSCLGLSAILAYNNKYKSKKHELGKLYNPELPAALVRTITESRKASGHWGNTQENYYCMKALADYSAEYESRAPSGTWAVSLSGEKWGEAKFSSVLDSPQVLGRPLLAQDLGENKELLIERNGQGRIYYNLKLNYSPLELARTATNAGIAIKKEISVKRDGKFELLTPSSKIERGELVRVDLYLDLGVPRNFVVVSDPLPGGLEALNSKLATSSSMDQQSVLMSPAVNSHWYSANDWIGFSSSRSGFYHQELRHDSVRFYSEYLPAGRYHLRYLTQAISRGEFVSLPAKAGEMYDPEIFGQTAASYLEVAGGR